LAIVITVWILFASSIVDFEGQSINLSILTMLILSQPLFILYSLSGAIGSVFMYLRLNRSLNRKKEKAVPPDSTPELIPTP